MKTFLNILFVFSLFLITVFPQDRIHRGVIPERPTPERLREIHKSNGFGLQGLKEKEALLLKSISSNWQSILKNQQREFYKEGFIAKDTRTAINKTLLGNGFLVIEVIYQTWNGSAWVNVNRWSSTYDGNSNQIEWLNQSWNGSAWVNDNKDSYTYDGNNNQTEGLYQTWDGSAWVNAYKYSYTYDGNNNQIKWLYQGWDGSAWMNVDKYSYTYDGNNNLTEMLTQTWDGSAWVNVNRWSSTYDGNNNEIEYLSQAWHDSAWVNYYKQSYTYDGNNNLTEQLFQTWDSSTWVNYFKGSFTYDGNNNQTEFLNQTWNGSAWVNNYNYIYSYILTGIEQFEGEVSTYSLSNNYPNPFNPSTTIKYQIPGAGIVSLKVYDVLGKEVATLVNEEKPVGSYEIDFNASKFSSGIYFYELRAGSFIEAKKMLLLK